MSESFITLTIGSEDTEQSLRLIRGFQKLRACESNEEADLTAIIHDYFGKPFAEVVFAKVSTEDDVLKYKRFIHAKYLEDMEHFMFSLKNRTLNDQRIWQDTYSEELSGYELSPSDIELKTQSHVTKHSLDKIVLDYECDDCYILKAAVYAAAFEAVGFEIGGLTTNNEYEA